MGWLSRLLYGPEEMQDARKTQPDSPGTNSFHYFPKKRGGVVVTHEKALELATCFGCCRAISEDIAKLPWNVYAVNNNQRERLDGSRLHLLLDTRPNPNMTAFTFRETLMMWALTWGNGYAEIERDMIGRPIALWPIAPDRVQPRRDTNGTVYYEINNQHQGQTILEQRDMFHVHGIGWDGLEGYSTIALAAQTLGFALAAEEHGSNFFGNNTTIGLALKTDMALGDQAYQRLKEELEGKTGSANAFQGMILEQGLDFAYPNMNMVDAQYVETRRATVEEICRWFRVPPHKVAELSRAHFANVENLNIDYATDTLMPWARRLEEEADWKLITSRARPEYTKIALGEMMRGDSESRAKWYREMSQIGVFSINEIRAMEDMDPIGPEGDEHFLQIQYTTLKNIVEQANSEDQDEEEVPIVEPAVRAISARLLKSQVNKSANAKRRYASREEYAGWITIESEKNSDRQLNAFMELSAFGIDPVRAYNAYTKAEREILFDCYEDNNPDYEKLTAAIMEAI